MIEDWISPVENLPTLHLYLTHDPVTGNPYAMSMHPTILRRIATREEGFVYASPKQVKMKLLNFLVANGVIDDIRGSFTAAGKNFASFDLQFLNRLPGFENVKIKHRCIDPAMLYWRGGEDLPSTAECCRRAGLPDAVAHTAVEDARQVIQLVRKWYDAQTDNRGGH